MQESTDWKINRFVGIFSKIPEKTTCEASKDKQNIERRGENIPEIMFFTLSHWAYLPEIMFISSKMVPNFGIKMWEEKDTCRIFPYGTCPIITV